MKTLWNIWNGIRIFVVMEVHENVVISLRGSLTISHMAIAFHVMKIFNMEYLVFEKESPSSTIMYSKIQVSDILYLLFS